MADARFLAACVQLTSTDDVTRNLAACMRLTGDAASRGAKLVVLPENFAFMGRSENDKFAIAETLDEAHPGPILAGLAAVAREHHVWLVAGGMPEHTDDGDDKDKVFNTCVVLTPEGRIAARYRKIHLFDVNIPGGAEFMESRTVAAGSEPAVVETPWLLLGLTICYDVRFPELYRRVGAMGARAVVVPAAFTLHTGKDHWAPLLRARAIENQVYVLAAAQVGRNNDKRVCWGHSVIVDPWGAVLAEAPDRECAIVAEIDLAYQDKVRKELPCLDHRRL